MKYLRFCGFVITALFLQTAAQAEFLIDPTGGTNLRENLIAPVSGIDPLDDGLAFARPLGFTFSLFDQNRTQINVTTNGFLTSSLNASPADVAFPASGSVRRIAAAWDDYILRPGDSIIEKKLPNIYSVTYFVHTLTGGESEFQIALFGGDVTIGNFQFQANDIAFTYQKMAAPQGGGATIGIDNGRSINATVGEDYLVPGLELGGNAQGRFTNFDNLPLFTGFGGFTGMRLQSANGNTLLFRREDISGVPTYETSVVAVASSSVVAPEPTTLTLVLTLGGLLARRRRLH